MLYPLLAMLLCLREVASHHHGGLVLAPFPSPFDERPVGIRKTEFPFYADRRYRQVEKFTLEGCNKSCLEQLG